MSFLATTIISLIDIIDFKLITLLLIVEIARLTLLGHVAVEVLLGPEAAEEVFSHVQLGPLHGCEEI